MNVSGEAVRKLVKRRVEFTPGFAAREFPSGFEREYGGSAARSPAPESLQLRRLFSRLHRLSWGRNFNRVTRIGSHIF